MTQEIRGHNLSKERKLSLGRLNNRQQRLTYNNCQNVLKTKTSNILRGISSSRTSRSRERDERSGNEVGIFFNCVHTVFAYV